MNTSTAPGTTGRVMGRPLAAGALALALGTTTSWTTGAAASPPPVDPTTLNPAPPDFFNTTCARTGTGITCDLHFTETPIDDEPNGVVCNGPSGAFEVVETATRSVVGKRFYSSEGDLLRRHFRDDWVGTMTNPDTGASVTYLMTNRILHDLPVPGDVGSGSQEVTTRLRVVSPDGSTVFVDAGRTVSSLADGSIEFRAGPHRVDDYFTGTDPSALAPLCEALS